MTPPKIEDVRIAVIGLGYVGLPLAVYLAQYFPVTGFDVAEGRIDDLKSGRDRTNEVTQAEFALAKHLSFTSDPAGLDSANFFIVTVPTPIDSANRPDLRALLSASRTVGEHLSKGDVVVYESTVFPGATEEICVPELEAASGLTLNEDFYAGYSPERINPGDETRRLPDILKITAGSTKEAGDLIEQVYAKVITAGTHRTSSIKVAEAAKVIENIQRDVNIALVNELSMLFKRLDLDTAEVLEAAGTKWNFHGYRPGLVGGHCIGVDPYYLTHKAQSVGFHPEMILAGRRINDGMANFVAHDILRAMLKHKVTIDGSRILVLGFTFKENCPDIRNTKIVDLVRELQTFANVEVFDPLADPAEVKAEYGVTLTNDMPEGPFDVLVLAVRHKDIEKLGTDRLKNLLAQDGLIYDIKGILPAGGAHARL